MGPRPSQVLPGSGEWAGLTQQFAGYSSVGGEYGMYIDRFLDMGGYGPSPFAWACPDGLKVLGVHVSGAGWGGPVRGVAVRNKGEWRPAGGTSAVHVIAGPVGVHLEGVIKHSSLH